MDILGLKIVFVNIFEFVILMSGIRKMLKVIIMASLSSWHTEDIFGTKLSNKSTENGRDLCLLVSHRTGISEISFS